MSLPVLRLKLMLFQPLVTPAVVPIGLTVCWSRLSKHAAFWGTLIGTVAGMTGWFGELLFQNVMLGYFSDVFF